MTTFQFLQNVRRIVVHSRTDRENTRNSGPKKNLTVAHLPLISIPFNFSIGKTEQCQWRLTMQRQLLRGFILL